jgi:23S rRNA pseudouridine2457 synthase
VRCLAFHKPYGVLSQFSPEPGSDKRTLKDYIPVAGVYPAGRLDYDSEGLMLLTDNGALQHRLTDPKFAHRRTYWVQVEGVPTPEQLSQLCTGVLISGYLTRPAAASILPDPGLPERVPPVRFRRLIPTAWIELTLTEGKNRQVRRMTAAVGLPTLRLLRVAIGGLRLDSLAPGVWRDLTAAEIVELNRPAPPSGPSRSSRSAPSSPGR